MRDMKARVKKFLLTALKCAYSIITRTIILLIAVFFTVMIGPIIEGKFFPVVKNAEYTLISKTERSTIIMVNGEKIRSCKFDSVSVLVNVNGSYVKGQIHFIEDTTKVPVSRPKGAQSFGAWEITPGSTGDIIVDVEHDCHSLWHTSTHLFTVSEKEK